VEGARLFARLGPAGVTTRQLHEAAGARNESALHYHFGGRDGLVQLARRHPGRTEAGEQPRPFHQQCFPS
jgi:AcrR family transcriptional regulator